MKQKMFCQLAFTNTWPGEVSTLVSQTIHSVLLQYILVNNLKINKNMVNDIMTDIFGILVTLQVNPKNIMSLDPE